MSQMDFNNKVLIMAGGTGGHIFPALSIAEYLLSKGVEVEWLGTKNSMEARVIGATDIPLHYISISGLRGKSVWKKIFSPLFILIAVMQSMVKVVRIKPACVLGMGGFVTGPGGLATWLLRKKLIIHEQNAVAGFTNLMLFPLANTVMEAFSGAFERKMEISRNAILSSLVKPEKAILIGNPLREEFSACMDPSQRFAMSDSNSEGAGLKILVIGGSLGAVAINKLIPELISLCPDNYAMEVFHQCGQRNFDETISYYTKHQIELSEKIRLEPFIENMAESYCWADLIICRAGAITVSEIASVGVPSILIPYPYAVDDHQTENAAVLKNNKAAWVIQENELDAQKLFTVVNSLILDRKKQLEMALAARLAANDSATEKAAEICLEACYA